MENIIILIVYITYKIQISLMNNNEKTNWKITVLLGIILGALVYGSVKVVQMGGINP